MLKYVALLYAFATCSYVQAWSQSCSNIGQTPLSAFPVCGTNAFIQSSVPICAGQNIPSPTCSSTIAYKDKNPYYYKFTCYQAGPLFFEITPNNLGDDYDWVVFDITNQNPTTIYSNASLVISSNWSGESGKTGMSNAGTLQFVCEGLGKPIWSRPSNLVVGHEYLLMISHFTDTQSGYSLSFVGGGPGSAVITDTTPPALQKATPNCDGNSILVKLNKKMLCNSIALNGSDFLINNSSANISSVVGTNCSSGFDTDEIIITLNTTLTAGSYNLKVKNGTDGNTIQDYCSKQIPVGNQQDFLYAPGTPTPLDSIMPMLCAPEEITLVFGGKKIKCNSVAGDASDFSITGTYPISFISATPTSCTNGVTDKIVLKLNQKLQQKGTFTIALKIGSDGNTLLDECDISSLVGSSKGFSIKDTVNADFTTIKLLGCVQDTISVLHPVVNEVNKWQWFVNGTLSAVNSNATQFLFTVFGKKEIKLIVDNGFCTATSTKEVDLDNFIKADFDVFEDNCPNEKVIFSSKAAGINLTYEWNFGDGFFDNKRDTTHIYASSLVDKKYFVTYTVTNSIPCSSSITKPVLIYKQCGEYIPTIFTPNGDGLNDTFGPLYAIKALNLNFKVYNRWGQLIYESKDWKKGWDGKINGKSADAGTYVWMMQYVDRDTKQNKLVKGTVLLAR
jgi:gliding motility-associated-like protein